MLRRKGVLDMERIRRMGVRVLALGALVILLSGCIKIDMDLEVRSDDTVSGSAVIGFSKQLLELTGGSLEDALGEDTLVPSDVEGVEVEPYEDDEFVGQRISFDAVPLEEFNQQDDADSLSIVREGDTYRVTGVLDFSSGEEETEIPFDAGQVFQNADVRISLAFPGDVIEANGEVDGNRVTWTPEVGERTELRAVASAIGGGTGGGSSIVWIVLALVAVAVIAGAIVVSNRRKAVTQGPPDDAGFSSSASATAHDAAVPAEPADTVGPADTVEPAAPGGAGPPVTPTMARDVPPPPMPPGDPGLPPEPAPPPTAADPHDGNSDDPGPQASR
jgi:hypothetical protein